jgi:hypothetical protein
VLARGGQATRAHRIAGAGAAAALIAVVTAASFLVSSLNAQPAAHVSTVTGTPAASAPSTGSQASSGPLASPPATSPTVPSGLPSASALAAIQQLGSTIRADVAAGQVRQDVGLDMDNLILPVLTQLASGQPAPVQQLVSTLRAKITTRLSEGGLTPQAADQLTSELGLLQSSAGSGS